MGTPPTPMPTFMWTGIADSCTQGLTIVSERATFQATDFCGVHVYRGSEHGHAGLGRDLDLIARPQPCETAAPELELTVHAEHELARHAELDADVGVTTLDLLDREQRRQEIGVAGGPGSVQVETVGARLDHRLRHEDHVAHGVVHGLFLRRSRFADATQRHQLGPVRHGAVGLRVATKVGHGAVLQGRDEV